MIFGRLRNRGGQRGHTVTELVVVLAVTGVIVIIGIPVMDDAQRSAALSRAAAQVHGLLVRSRSVAVLRARNCAVVFDRETGGDWVCYVAEDGDGDGVRRADIARGTDPVVGRRIRLSAGVATPGILDGRVPDPSGRGVLGGDLGDPIRAGRGNMVSFASGGSATPSSVYLTDHVRRMVVIRVYGGTARINRLAWRRGMDGWVQGG